MLFRLFIVISLFFLTNHLNAQNKLLLCTEYDQNGNYKGAYDEWRIGKGGNFMYLFYESSTPINDTLFVMIYKTFNRKDTSLLEYDHYYLVPDVSKKFAVNKYIFTKSGKYKITVYDRNNKQIAQPYVADISLIESDYSDEHFVDTWYYKTSEIKFYESVVNDSMVGKNTVFNYKTSNNNVILRIEQQNKQPFKTRHFYCKIYSADNCHELIGTDTYYIDENWHWTYVSVNINQKGKFIVELYNDDDVFINSAQLEIR